MKELFARGKELRIWWRKSPLLSRVWALAERYGITYPVLVYGLLAGILFPLLVFVGFVVIAITFFLYETMKKGIDVVEILEGLVDIFLQSGVFLLEIVTDLKWSLFVLTIGSGIIMALFALVRWVQRYRNASGYLWWVVTKDLIKILVIFFITGIFVYMFIPTVYGSGGEKCTLLVGLYCKDHRATPHEIILKVENGMGRDVTIGRMIVSESSKKPQVNCTFDEVHLSNGEERDFISSSCSGVGLYPGTKYKLDIEFIYWFEDISFKHTGHGELFATAEGDGSSLPPKPEPLIDLDLEWGLILPFWTAEFLALLIILFPDVLRILFKKIANFRKRSNEVSEIGGPLRGLNGPDQ